MEEGVDVSHGSQTGGSAEQDDGTAEQLPSTSRREPDIFLPIANINHIMKRVLPANAKVSKEAKESLQECVTEFIGFITSEANDRCLIEKRSTINADDLIWALGNLGFENYVEPLTAYLHRCREEDIRIFGGSSGLSVEKEESGLASLPNVQIGNE